ncbi:penicillin-binding protein [Halobacillus salinarum]|uniref:serine-type D-Ala-D-Ala carboxypeptidase n=1 Tax=Halobacillus salinarum TaxID=2932257 RepID=A0ABY4EGE8_9BACI|nr:penicillin-binding protein [Halobacillus salinarum]UOQ43138.1 penicillin-binding protein [Halobacillus salinarum]
MKSPNTHRGAALLILLFSIIFLVIVGRFLYIETTSTVEGVDLEKWAEKARTSSYEIDATRGKIYDKNGMVLAYDRPTYRLYAIVDPEYSANLKDPKHVTDPEKTAEKLAPLLNMDAEDIEQKLEDGRENGKFQVEFGSKGKELSQEKMEEIKDEDLNGIQFKEEAKRYYPNGMFASHVIGFARSVEGHIKGVTGIEKQMEKYLKEQKGKISYERDKYGTKLLDPKEVMTKPDNGDNVYLTIDQKIQTFLEDAMSQVNEQYKPKKMVAAVMDPKTGQVLAMSNRPSYDPNDLSDVDNWYNDVISYPFEPGSTMKMFTWASAMEEGVYKGSKKYKSGSYQVTKNSATIHDYNQSWGKISYDEGFQRSSNVAAAKLMQDVLGPDKFRDYLSAFHLDQPSGIDLPGEETGKILYGRPIEQVTTSFGQGTTVTPVQLMTAATAIANDGKMMQPYMLDKIASSETGETIKKGKPNQIGTPISKDTAEKMRDLLGTVITGEHGTGSDYKINDFSVAGKTGTAQIPGADGKYMYGHNNYIFSFMGMAPKEDPELLMYVAVKQPELKGNETGSEPVSHIFKTVMENSLHYLDIQPDKNNEQKVSEHTMEDLSGLSTEKAKKKLEKTYNNVTVIGKGDKVTKTIPEEGTKLLADEKVMLVTDQPVMPDVKGWSLRDVHRLAQAFDLKIETMGSGYVTKQSIDPGTSLKNNGYLVVELAPPQ